MRFARKGYRVCGEMGSARHTPPTGLVYPSRRGHWHRTVFFETQDEPLWGEPRRRTRLRSFGVPRFDRAFTCRISVAGAVRTLTVWIPSLSPQPHGCTAATLVGLLSKALGCRCLLRLAHAWSTDGLGAPRAGDLPFDADSEQ